MAITVRDIVELAQKKGCVLATGESKLSKEVYYVDTMEIPDNGSLDETKCLIYYNRIRL